MERRERIRARRRISVRIGLAGLLLGTLATASACIFDKSDYQGGGRIDKGATANTASQSATAPVPTDTTMPTDTTQPMGLDAATGVDAAEGG